jgi:hypothetical protein
LSCCRIDGRSTTENTCTKANDGICVGSQETDEFIDEEKVEYMFDTEGDLQTGVQTDNGIDSLSNTASKGVLLILE